MEKFNGWTNYATWLVNLEMFDGFDFKEYWPESDKWDAYDLGDFLKGYAEELIESSSSEGLARDYALAFISNVNWHEIAAHYQEEETEE